MGRRPVPQNQTTRFEEAQGVSFCLKMQWDGPSFPPRDRNRGPQPVGAAPPSFPPRGAGPRARSLPRPRASPPPGTRLTARTVRGLDPRPSALSGQRKEPNLSLRIKMTTKRSGARFRGERDAPCRFRAASIHKNRCSFQTASVQSFRFVSLTI